MEASRPVRGTLLQGFEWYLPNDGQHWNRLASRAHEFSENGVTAVWIPPPYKGFAGQMSVGYDVYDPHDLGEFPARDPHNIRTKYGTRDELKAAVGALNSAGVDVYLDVVLNHRMGGEESEIVRATPYSADNRKQKLGEPYEIEVFSKFRYPARNGKYSQYEWNVGSFDSVDYNHREPHRKGVVWLFEGKQFDDFVSLERGNYDHLLGCDVDFQSSYVRKELTDWGKWMVEKPTMGGCQGMRLDALKHIPTWFWPDWLRAVRARGEEIYGKEFFVVGEYVQYDVGTLRWYLDATENLMSLFDFPLLNKFHNYSNNGRGSDMRKIFDGTLVKDRPERTVTFIANHDTVPSQGLERHVQDWFKPLAYALILLRTEGYPCVFLADVDGSEYHGEHGHHVKLPSFKETLYSMMKARQQATFGRLRDYFDHFHVVGWTFDGRIDPGGPPSAKAMAVIMSGGDGGSKRMDVGSSGISFRDVLGHKTDVVTSGGDNHAVFSCNGGSVSVYVQI